MIYHLLKCNILTFFHKLENVKHAFSSSACVECGTAMATGNVYRKSSDNKIIASPNFFGCFVNLLRFYLKSLKIFYAPSCIHPMLLVIIGAIPMPLPNSWKCCKLEVRCFAYSTAILKLNGLFYRLQAKLLQCLTKQELEQ